MIPSSFSTGGSLYCNESSYTCIISNKTIKVTSSSLSVATSFTFTIANLKTPATYSDMQTSNKTFNVSSYTSGGSLIDTTNTILEFTLSCDPSCQTCKSTNITQCLSCYPNTTLINNQCAPCLPGQYKDQSTGLCQSCNTSCRTCITTKSTCTSCNSPLLLDTTSSTCVSQCPFNTTAVEGACQ